MTMQRREYLKAALVVEQYHRSLLDALTERLIEEEGNEATRNPFTRDVDSLLDKFSHKFWATTTCLEQLRAAGGVWSRKPLQVARLNSSQDSIEHDLADWLTSNPAAKIENISFLDQLNSLTCVIVYGDGC